MTDTDIDTDPGAGPDPGDEPTTPRGVPGRTVVIVAVVVSLLIGVVVFVIAARPGGEDPDPEPTTTTAAPTTTTSDEEPPGTEPDAVEPYVADLLTAYDETTAQILADPAIAGDADHPLYGDLRALLTPESEMTDPVMRALSRRGDQRIAQEPLSADQLPVRRTVEGDIETVSADEVRFATCTRYDYRLVNSAGEPIEVGVDESEPGTGVAVRVDGRWTLNRLDMAGQLAKCEESE